MPPPPPFPSPRQPISVVNAYARIHATYQLLRFTSPPQPLLFVGLQLPAVAAALLYPSRRTLFASALSNVLTILWHLPAVVDMDWWAMQTDLTVCAALLLFSSSSSFVAFVSRVVRIQMAIFYLAAGLWKCTADHSNPQLSCSSLRMVQILCGWLPGELLSRNLVRLVARSAPTVTVVVETGIPLLLLWPSASARRKGALLAVALHVGIMVAPLPLSIADFGAFSTSRLLLAVAPEASAAALAEVEAWLGSLASDGAGAGDGGGARGEGAETTETRGQGSGPDRETVVDGVALCAAGVGVVGGVVSGVHGSSERILANLCFTGLAALLCRAVYLASLPPSAADEEALVIVGQPETARPKKAAAAPAVAAAAAAEKAKAESTAVSTRTRPAGMAMRRAKDSTDDEPTDDDEPVARGGMGRAAGRVLVGGAAFYAFGMPALGLLDVGGPITFAHLKLHGGSNHAFLPAGLLQRWLARASPAPASLSSAVSSAKRSSSASASASSFGSAVGAFLFADWAGGVVRVESSTSRYLNGFYPGEVAELHPEPLLWRTLRRADDIDDGVKNKNKDDDDDDDENTVHWTDEVNDIMNPSKESVDRILKGHEQFRGLNVARLFTHPGVRERNLRGKNLEVGGGLTALGLGLVFKQSSANGAEGRSFIRYTLPALELRLMLEGMRRAGETFSLTYTRIAGAPPNDDHAAAEAWRAEGCGTTVQLHEEYAEVNDNGGGGGRRSSSSRRVRKVRKAQTCVALDTCEKDVHRWRQKKCTSGELAMLEGSPPGWLARKLMLSNPYPILHPQGRYCGSSG